ncbi:MAG: hypothetical protein WDN27_04260 [Candidatus Saccharibacteria bacterium]
MDIASAIKNGSTASTSAAFAALTPTLGSADGGILVEFIAGMPGSGQTDTLTLPASYANSATTASTKSASVNMSAGSWDSTSVATANTSYTPPTVTQSVSVKYVNFAFSLRPKQALPVTDTFTGTNARPGHRRTGRRRHSPPARQPFRAMPVSCRTRMATRIPRCTSLAPSRPSTPTSRWTSPLATTPRRQFVSIAWRSDGSADPGGGSGTNNGYELALLPSYGLLELSKAGRRSQHDSWHGPAIHVPVRCTARPHYPYRQCRQYLRVVHRQPAGHADYAYTDSSSPYTTAGSLWLGFESGTTGVGTETATFDNVSFGFQP